MVGTMLDTSRSTDSDALSRVVEAARQCYARHGVRKTRMAAVAEAAGVVRQTLYAFVSSREELIRCVFAARLRELSATIEDRLRDRAEPLPDSLVECMAVMAEVGREDREFAELAEALGQGGALRFMTGPGAAHAVVVKLVRPYYARAAQEGLLRNGISLDDMAWWVRNALAPLLVRTDVDGDELRHIVRKFVLPALLRDRDS